MLKAKKWSLAIGMLGASLLLAACSSGKTASTSATKTANLMESSELPSMDISLATDTESFDMLNNTNEGLYRLGKNSKVTPGLATKTQLSNGGKTYTFILRHSKWSNGDPVTAKDFVYSWRRTVNPKTASQYAYLFSGIKNADAIMAGKAKPATLGIKAVGRYRLVVNLDRPIQYFKLLMGFVSFFPQNQHAVEAYGKKYGTTSTAMVYNGPFRMTGWTGTNDTWKLVKNKTYWDAKTVKVSTLNFHVEKDTNTSLNLYNSGKLDQTLLSGTQVRNYKNNADYVARKAAATFYLEMNQKDSNPVLAKAFSNENIRRALSLAINRKQFVNDVLANGSTVPLGYVSTDLAKNPQTEEDFAKQAYVKNSVSYDAKLAKQYWAKGLKEIGQTSLSFTLLIDDTDSGKKAADYLQGQLEKVLPNLKVTNRNVPFKTRLTASQKGQFDVVLSAWGADFSDPISFLELFTSTNSYNNGHWQSTAFDQAIQAANVTHANNATQRWADMITAEKTLMASQGVIPLYQQTVPWLVKSSIKGIIYNTAGTSYNYKYVHVTK